MVCMYPKNKNSLHLFSANTTGIKAARGRTTQGLMDTERRGREGGGERNNDFVKTFVFSEKGPVHFMSAVAELWLLPLCRLLLLWMCSTVPPQDVGLGSHSFCKEEGLFLAFYAHKDKKGLGQPCVSLKSALVSGYSANGFVPTKYVAVHIHVCPNCHHFINLSFIWY